MNFIDGVGLSYDQDFSGARPVFALKSKVFTTLTRNQH